MIENKKFLGTKGNKVFVTNLLLKFVRLFYENNKILVLGKYTQFAESVI